MKKTTHEEDKKKRFVARGSQKTKRLLRVVEDVSTVRDEAGRKKVL
jgi:signal transduction histidine kinase